MHRIKSYIAKCNKCGAKYMEGPFINMDSGGERTSSTVEIYGEFYDLCPECTAKLYDFINEKKENKA